MVKTVTGRKPESERQGATVIDKEAVKRFSKAAKTYSGKATISQQAAQRTLIGLGISTQAGKLTKRYR